VKLTDVAQRARRLCLAKQQARKERAVSSDRFDDLIEETGCRGTLTAR
jgi:hypothetical protein